MCVRVCVCACVCVTGVVKLIKCVRLYVSERGKMINYECVMSVLCLYVCVCVCACARVCV